MYWKHGFSMLDIMNDQSSQPGQQPEPHLMTTLLSISMFSPPLAPTAPAPSSTLIISKGGDHRPGPGTIVVTTLTGLLLGYKLSVSVARPVPAPATVNMWTN